MSEATEMLRSYVKGLERKLAAERALADDLAAKLIEVRQMLEMIEIGEDRKIQHLLARYREARNR